MTMHHHLLFQKCRRQYWKKFFSLTNKNLKDSPLPKMSPIWGRRRIVVWIILGCILNAITIDLLGTLALIESEFDTSDCGKSLLNIWGFGGLVICPNHFSTKSKKFLEYHYYCKCIKWRFQYGSEGQKFLNICKGGAAMCLISLPIVGQLYPWSG